MKIRSGFVSNSSSSSFVVPYRDRILKAGEKPYYDVVLTPEEKEKLETLGFKPTHCKPELVYYSECLTNDSSLWATSDIPTESIAGSTLPCLPSGLGFYVICNEDEILESLLKLNVSFEALCHYGHYTIKYKKDSKFFDVYMNLGIMHYEGDDFFPNFKDNLKRAIRKVNVKKYLAGKAFYQ